MVPKSKEAVEQRIHSGMSGMDGQAGTRPRRATLQQEMGPGLPFCGEAIRTVPSANGGEAGTGIQRETSSKLLLHGEATGTLLNTNTNNGEARTGIQCEPKALCHNRSGRGEEPTERHRARKIVDLSGEVEPSDMEAAGWEPPEEWIKAVDTMRTHQRLCWAKICEREIRTHEKRMEEDEEYAKRTKERRDATPEQGDRSPERKDDASKDATPEGKKKRPRSRTAYISPSSTSHVSSEEAERFEKNAGKKTRRPKGKNQNNAKGKDQRAPRTARRRSR